MKTLRSIQIRFQNPNHLKKRLNLYTERVIEREKKS
jgi:hypothetical protein